MDNEQSYSREAVVAELEFQATEQMRPMFRSFKTECFQILIPVYHWLHQLTLHMWASTEPFWTSDFSHIKLELIVVVLASQG